MDKLELATTDELIKELENRYDSWVFMGVKKKYKGSEDTHEDAYSGGVAQALGLCEVLKTKLLDYCMNGEPPEVE